MRQVSTTLDDILSLVHCSQDYGFHRVVLMQAFAGMTGWVTDEEIAVYAASFLTPEQRARGYGEEDAESAAKTLTEWRNTYCVRT